MSERKQETVRETIRDLSQRHAEHDRQSGRLPDSRKIEQHWSEVARRNERQRQDKP